MVDWRFLYEDENGVFCVVWSLKFGEEDGVVYVFIRDVFICVISVRIVNCWLEEEKYYGVLEGDGGWLDLDGGGGDIEVGEEG